MVALSNKSCNLKRRSAAVPSYYFDIREGDEFSPDEVGLEFSTLQAVQKEAARSLADLAGDTIREWSDRAGHRMAVEVRDDNGPVLVMKITFESAFAVEKPTP